MLKMLKFDARGNVKVKITRATVVGGKPVAVGDEVDCSAQDAAYLMNIGKAAPYVSEEPKAEPVAEPPAPKKGKR